MNHNPQRASDTTSFSAYAAASTFARYLSANYSAALPYDSDRLAFINVKAINRPDSGSRWAMRQVLSVQFGYKGCSMIYEPNPEPIEWDVWIDFSGGFINMWSNSPVWIKRFAEWAIS